MSPGEFAGVGASSGVGAAVQGVQTLAGAMTGAPQQMAQARYLGAETARAGVQTQALQQTQKDGQDLVNLLKGARNPDGTLNVGNVQDAFAIGARNPEIASRLANMVAGMQQAGAQTPGAAPAAQANADKFSAGTGVQAAGNTFTGQALDNANRTGVANIGAGATVRSAQIGAGATLGAANISATASRANNAATIAGENQRSVTQALGPDGKPVFITTSEAGATHAPYYDSGVANTVAGINAKPVPVLTPNGSTALVTTADAVRTGATPAASSPAEVQARIAQTATTPAAPEARPAAAVAASPAQSPITDEQNATTREANLATAAGRPPPGAGTVKDAADLDALVVGRLKALMPAGHFTSSNAPSQALLDPIRLQAVWLRDHDPSIRGDWNAAVTQATTNVIGSRGEGLDFNTKILSSGPSQIILKPDQKITWPAGMAVPAQYAGTAGTPPPPPASALGATIAGTGTGTTPPATGSGAGAGSSPAPAPPPGTPPQPSSGAPPSSLAGAMTAPLPGGAPGRAPAPAPNVPPAQKAPQAAVNPQAAQIIAQQGGAEAVLAQARAAVAQGKDPTAIAQRLAALGLSLPSQQAGN